MFYINSFTFSSFNLANLIGIFAPILGQINIILTNLALYTYILDFNCYLSCKDIVTLFPIFILCGIISTGVGYIFFHSSRIAEKFIKNA